MNRRLDQFMKAERLTSAKFAEILAVQPSSISHLLSGRNKPNFDFVAKLLLMFPKLNPRWIINGEGTMYIDDQLPSKVVQTDLNSQFDSTDISDDKTAFIDRQESGNQLTSLVNDVITSDESKVEIENANQLSDDNLQKPSEESTSQPSVSKYDSNAYPEFKPISARSVDRVLLLYNDNTFEFFDHSND